MTQTEFSEVYHEFYGKLRRYLERMVGRNDAEDLTQEVFVKINKGLAGFGGQSSLSTWVYRIATNAALDKMRSRSFRQDNKARSLDTATTEAESPQACVEAKSLSAEREAIRDEMTECIREFVDRLPADFRTVVILSEIKELKNQEIADILGVSLDTVKIRLHRARVRLKAEFEAGCHFYHDDNGNLACDRKESEKNDR
ncbi:MAG: RNA polymerase sigma factor [Phycisphaerales bacterium]|nr:MAG: RNA polymerase sigma factor [Phycisphaerales bacterium]